MIGPAGGEQQQHAALNAGQQRGGGYQSWVVSPGLGIGDKPTGYAPPVFNGATQPAN
ncbi:hypothetical protein [Micromonospora sp. NPDC049301]|uniref:hypothetical protein n=1 Tax=Micromonospora sp. NPDC049301 TaxID=3155723 RepID=UPI00341B97A4